MAEKIVSPGVFTSEIDASFLPAAVADIGAAIIGPTVKGPAGIPTVVNSFGEFEAKFGTTFKSGSGNQQYLTSLAVREYLKNSNQCTIVRVLAGTYSPASASIASSTIGGASAASASFVINQVPSGSVTELTIGGVDFISVVSSSIFDNSSTERYFDGSSVSGTLATAGTAPADTTEYAKRLAASINTAASESLVSVRAIPSAVAVDTSAGVDPTKSRIKLLAMSSGSAGNIAFSSGSYTGAPDLVGATKSFYTYDLNGNSDFSTAWQLEGGTDGITDQTSFKLYTLGDGDVENSYTAKEGTNNMLSSGSKDNVRWEVVSKNNAQGTFNLLIRRGDDISKRKITLESWNNVGLDPESSNYIAKRIGDSVQTVRVDGSGLPYLQPSGSYPNKSKYVRVEVVSPTPEYLDSNGKLTNGNASASLPALGSGSMWGGSDGTVQNPKNFFDKITTANSQGLNLTLDSSNGYTDYVQALNLLKNADEYDINMILMPGVTSDLHGGLVQKAIDVCEDRGDAFYVADPVGFAGSVTSANTEAEKYDSNYTAMYWPWVQVPDTVLGKNVWVPPSTVMGGIIAFNDKVAHPWFAPAGLNRGGIDVAIQAEKKLTQADRDTLYENAVNPIATFPGQGVVVFGQKTLQKKASALDRVNVRRLLIKVKKFIASSSRFLVFEQNTASTRRRFLNIVNPFLEQVQSNSGLSAFRVVMDDTNNTPDLVDRNILYGQIFVQPTRTAEFIVLDFTIQPSGATFPE